ncbi:ankyrin-2 [Quercus suber]|uniref:Ankyrin-2 n=1 Tax=Quercus suber TaxID=58331 RepID=A0AAW0IHY8_QUESU
MGTKSASSIAVHEVLTEDNYLDWCVRVKTYLQAQNLWHIVESQKNPPQFEINRRAYNEWNKKNVMALHVIQISCGPKTFSTIRGVTKARIAWKTLEEMYKPKLTKSRRTTTKNSSSKRRKRGNNEISSAQIDSDSTTEENNPECLDSRSSINSENNKYLAGKDIQGKNAHYEELCKHLKSGKSDDWDKIKEILKKHPEVLGKNITVKNKKVLHLAVFAGHENIVQELVKQMSENDLVLEKRDQFGYTALAETTLHGNCEMAKCMIDKNHKLVRIPSYKKLLPVVLAVFHKHIKLARYLYRRTPLKDLLAENGLNGVTLMIQVMYTRDFDIALDLIRCNQNLAFALDREECSPLSALASMPHAFKRSKLVFWKQWIYESK